MSDLLKLLDGNADEVKAGLTGKTRGDLVSLRAAERDGKTRKSVLEALDAAIDGSEADGAGSAAAAPDGVAADGSAAADIAPATEFAPSGAPVQTVPDIDVSHPAVDANPRENTTELQNRIDFNDPSIEGHEAVEQNLKDQAKA